MPANLMEAGKRLDFSAPLLSARRIRDSTTPPPRRAPPPLESGPVRRPKDDPGSDLPPPPRAAPKLGSSVRTRKPFQTFSDLVVVRSPERAESGGSGMKAIVEITDDDPSPPLPVRVPDSYENRAAEAATGPTAPVEEEGDEEEEEEEAFSDALDTLSRTASFMNCSVSGLPEPAEPPGGLSADPQVRDFMMGRFLPAAKAVASESPLYNFRKTAAPKPAETVGSGDHRRPPLPRPYQHRPIYVQQYPRVPDYKQKEEEEEEDEDYEDTRPLATKGCGLLPKLCLKSSFCMLNPLPGMKPRRPATPPRARRTGSPMTRSTQNRSLGQSEEEHSWQAVHRHKLGQRYQPRREDELNHPTYYWSGTQTADGSSPFHRSTGGTASPYHSEPTAASPFHEGKVSVEMSEGGKSGKIDASDSSGKDSESLVIASCHSSWQGSGSMSPAINSGAIAENRAAINSIEQNSEIGGDSPTIEGGNGLHHEFSEVAKPGSQLCTERSNLENFHHKNRKPEVTKDLGLNTEERDVVQKDVKLTPSVLPLPLPKSPSESWLSRALPSVLAKKPPVQSFLGMQFLPYKEQSSQVMTDRKKELDVKPPRPRQTRFTKVLGNPGHFESEI